MVRGGQLHRVSFVWHGDPGLGSLNAKHKVHRFGPKCPACHKSKQARVGNSDQAERFKNAIALLARSAASICPAGGVTMPGAVAVRITVYLPRTYTVKSGEQLEGLPFGDVDATPKLILDALEAARIVRNDGQVTDLGVRKKTDRGNPRILVAVQRIDAGAKDDET